MRKILVVFESFGGWRRRAR